MAAVRVWMFVIHPSNTSGEHHGLILQAIVAFAVTAGTSVAIVAFDQHRPSTTHDRHEVRQGEGRRGAFGNPTRMGQTPSPSPFVVRSTKLLAVQHYYSL